MSDCSFALLLRTPCVDRLYVRTPSNCLLASYAVLGIHTKVLFTPLLQAKGGKPGEQVHLLQVTYFWRLFFCLIQGFKEVCFSLYGSILCLLAFRNR